MDNEQLLLKYVGDAVRAVDILNTTRNEQLEALNSIAALYLQADPAFELVLAADKLPSGQITAAHTKARQTVAATQASVQRHVALFSRAIKNERWVMKILGTAFATALKNASEIQLKNTTETDKDLANMFLTCVTLYDEYQPVQSARFSAADNFIGFAERNTLQELLQQLENEEQFFEKYQKTIEGQKLLLFSRAGNLPQKLRAKAANLLRATAAIPTGLAAGASGAAAIATFVVALFWDDRGESGYDRDPPLFKLLVGTVFAVILATSMGLAFVFGKLTIFLARDPNRAYLALRTFSRRTRLSEK